MTRRPAARAAPRRKSAQGPAAQQLIPAILTPARKREIAGATLLAVGVLTLVSFVSNRGQVTAAWVAFLGRLMGDGRWLLPLLLGGTGAWLLVDSMDDQVELRLARPAGAVALFLSLLGLWQLLIQGLTAPDGSVLAPASGYRGGFLGYQLARILTGALGLAPAAVVLILVAGYGAGTVAGLSLREMLDRLGQLLFDGAGRLWNQRGSLGGALRAGGRSLWGARPAALSKDARPEDDAFAAPLVTPTDTRPVQTALALDGRGEVSAPPPVAPPAAADDAAPAAPLPASGAQWTLPDMAGLLDAPLDVVRSPEEAELLARTIEQTLAEFGIPVEVVQINVGPTITQFGLRPGYTEKAGIRSKVPVRRILALQNDLALALAASPVRILAPVPGRPYVGVELPNASKTVVSLRGVMQSEAFQLLLKRGGLPIALGRDTGGNDVAVDLTRMPHLLIAGATGSGKSVCVNTLIASLLLSHTPDSLKMVLVDPKRVEMTQYRGLPHLATPVVVDAERVVGVLQWAVREMDRRYRAFAEAGARHLAAYNRLMDERSQTRLPFLVIVIDELADLMMLAPEETERLITRLAQLARATGIHLVLATQRPSVDVVTGLIKANFPSRIAFAVSSSVDSRVILDQQGAEKLLGQGDMLYQSSDDSKLRRLQGCYVSDEEVERLVHFWKFNARKDVPGAVPNPAAERLGIPEPMIQPELWEQMADPQGGALADEHDALWDEAVTLIRSHSAASTSFLQRKLKIGYSRAARLIDSLEAAGLVGPASGNAPREVTIASDADVADARGYKERLDAVFGPEAGPADAAAPELPEDFLPRDIDPRRLAPVPLPWRGADAGVLPAVRLDVGAGLAVDADLEGDLDMEDEDEGDGADGASTYWSDADDDGWDLGEDEGGAAPGAEDDDVDGAGDGIRPWLRG
ncbi:MAG: DNA translocase FtsK 4TM domain-containing protein [Ardenticatenia bacterium]|nr:DNA translocase FtsK 4TM domain-containing protein [Ardenticatenia bacterium]